MKNILGLLMFLFSFHALGVGTADQDISDGPGTPGGDRPSSTLQGTEKNLWNDPLKEAQALIKDYEKLDRGKKSFGYKVFEVIFDHIGPVILIHESELGEKPSLSSRLQNTGFRNFTLSPESVQMFSEKINFFRKHALDAIFDYPRYETFDKAREIVKELMALTNHPEAYRGYRLATLYRSDQYRVLKSFKTGFYHLPAEILRFTTAIVIVRLATCFGSSMWNTMSFKPVAKSTDPACVSELGQMFVDPIFYAGFSSFVLASRAATPVMLNALRMIDPKHGPVSQATARLVVPQFSMAVGFIADHIVRTLLQNKDIQQCLVSLTGKNRRSFALNKTSSPGVVTDENGEGFQVYDYYQSVGGASCRRAGNYINSDQFLKEELGVGVVSLVLAAVSLSALTAGTSKLVQMSTARLSAALAGKITLILSVKGPFGLIIGTGMGISRMVVFLGLSELITPYVSSAYHVNFMEPKLDDKAETFIHEYEKIFSGKDGPEELVRIFEEETVRELNVRGKKIRINMGREKQCAEYYAGYQANGDEPLCTNIPMITEIMSFHDYSKAWRSKKILGDFNLAVTRWKKKLTDFFDNYYSSREQVRYLVRSREIYLTGKSQEHELMEKELYGSAIKILVEEEGLSSEEAESVLEDMKEEVVRQMEEPNYRSPIIDLEPLNPPYPHPRQVAFGLLMTIFDKRLDFVLNEEGQYYYGIYEKNHVPDSSEVDTLISQIIEFIDLGPVIVRSYFWPQERILPYEVREHLKGLGFPLELSHYPFSMESLRRLLMSDVEEDRVYGLILFKSWAPSMYGPVSSSLYNPPDLDGKVRRPMGFVEERQYSLYESISGALEHYDPLFKHEYIYLNGATFGPRGEKTKTEDNVRWSDSYRNFDTSELYAHSLTHLICGARERSFINREGMALEFPFPRLLDGNLCKNLYQPVHDHDGNNSQYPLVTRSQFTSSERLYVGLHQAYIQAPDDESNPLLFDKETQARQWWDENILPEGIQILGKMEKAYGEMIRDEFVPYLKRQESVETQSSWERFQRRFFPWVDDGKKQEAGNYTSTESLTVSIINELGHYHRAILSLVDPSVKLEMDEKLKTLSGCFLELLHSIPDKKYKEAKKQCKESPESIILAIRYQNGVLNQGQVEGLLRFDEEELKDVDNEQKKMLIRSRVLLELARALNSLYEEIFTYNRIVNHLFDFNLKKKDLEFEFE